MTLTEWECDILMLSETWLQSSSVIDSFLDIPSFNVFRKDRPEGGRGGGLLVYVKSSLKAHRRTDLEYHGLEYIVLELNLRDLGSCILFCCYRSPSVQYRTFFDELSKALSKTLSSTLFLLGDFNAKHAQWTSAAPNAAGNYFMSVLHDFSLTQCITCPTRYSSDGQHCSTLDLFATNRRDLVQHIDISDPISDHCCVKVKLSVFTSNNRSQSSVHCGLDYEKANWIGLRKQLSKTPLLEAIQGTSDVNVAWKTWSSIVKEAVERFVPMRTVSLRGHAKHKAWMSAYLRRISRKKHRLFRAARASRLPEDWSKYTSFRNFCNTEFQRKKKQYFNKINEKLDEELDGSHRWWRKAKNIASIRKAGTCAGVPSLEENGIIANKPAEKSDMLANFFARQCSTPTPDSNDAVGCPYPLPKNHPVFEFPPISEHAVLKQLLKLSPFKSSGCRILTNRVLREIAPFIASSLAYLYNLSINSAVFPDEWKTAIVTPVFKNRGKSADPTNYRPISLLPAISKVLDAIQCKSFTSYLLRNHLLSDHQFGFLPGRSTTQQLLHIVSEFTKAQGQKQNAAAVFLDFEKAFDKVWHPGLLHKLANFGVGPHSLAWLKSYLFKRSLQVQVDSVLSPSYPVTTGVPQGSHLGPILFAVFIDDLPAATLSPTELYADDALLFEKFDRMKAREGLDHLRQSVLAASQWATTWKGRFAPLKSELLPIGQDATQQCLEEPILIEGQPIKVVHNHKHLGVVLSHDLLWHDHIEQILVKAKKRAGLMRHMSQYLTTQVSAKLYCYYIRPTLEYASPVWHGSISSEQALALERVQASVARAILQADWMTPKSVLLERLQWPALRWRREISSLVVFHELIITRPTFLSDLFSFASSKTDRHLRKPFQLLLRTANSARDLKSFFYRSALLWNTLPHDIQSIKKKPIFKCALETHWSEHKYCPYKNIDIP